MIFSSWATCYTMLKRAAQRLASQPQGVQDWPNAYHDAKAETQRGGQEGIAILDPEVLLPRELSNDDIDAYDRGSEYACYAAQAGHDPSSLVVGERHLGRLR